jgi:hypothetical protein
MSPAYRRPFDMPGKGDEGLAVQVGLALALVGNIAAGVAVVGQAVDIVAAADVEVVGWVGTAVGFEEVGRVEGEVEADVAGMEIAAAAGTADRCAAEGYVNKPAVVVRAGWGGAEGTRRAERTVGGRKVGVPVELEVVDDRLEAMEAGCTDQPGLELVVERFDEMADSYCKEAVSLFSGLNMNTTVVEAA